MDSKEPAQLSVCHTGVVLRVMLAMLVVLWLTTAYSASGLTDWLSRWAYACVGVLPACLLWLLALCALQKQAAVWQRIPQRAGGSLLGGLAGAYGHVQMSLFEWSGHPQQDSAWAWVPPIATGLLAGWLGMWWLAQRQRQHVPAQTEARLQELQARIRPHFLFNTLNTAIALVQVDPTRAEEVLQDLADLFRRALSEPATQTLMSEEIDLARRYLGIEQLRLGDRLAVSWEIDPPAQGVQTPVLLLQPLLENAVRHGVEPRVGGGWVEVMVQRQGQRVSLTVMNSLPAQMPPPSLQNSPSGHGLALLNVQQRLQLLHDVEAQFESGIRGPDNTHAERYFRVYCAWPVSVQGTGAT